MVVVDVVVIVVVVVVDLFFVYFGRGMGEGANYRRGSRNFSGRGVEEENFETKMFVDTLINACTHKN